MNELKVVEWCCRIVLFTQFREQRQVDKALCKGKRNAIVEMKGGRNLSLRQTKWWGGGGMAVDVAERKRGED
jgi:hypothetical protein